MLKFYKGCHLYVVSDEILNDDGYSIDGEEDILGEGVNICHIVNIGNLYPHWYYDCSDGSRDEGFDKPFGKKIIATTDKSLKLPLISDEFINTFVLNPVKEVMVTYKDSTIVNIDRI